MTRIPKIFALLAFLAAAGCRDSYPSVQPPLDVLYFPVGMTVRQMPADPSVASRQYGWSQLAVVNSNFDLRYDEQSGGTVLVVIPDESTDSDSGGNLQVAGSARIASFGGELALVQPSCPAGWPNCPGYCPQAITDPVLAAGGSKLVLASRSALQIYRLGVDATGALSCGSDCTYDLPIDRVDPYGVGVACSSRSGTPTAYAFVSHLQSTNGLGWMSRVNLIGSGQVDGLVLGDNPTYTSIFDPVDDQLFITSSIAINAAFRWFNPLVATTEVNGYLIPDYRAPSFSGIVPGAVARDMALSSDGKLLYVVVQLFDVVAAAQTGVFLTSGGALAIFDLSKTPFAEPRMALVGLDRTCVGAGQIRRLPDRPGKPDLFAITCDSDGALAIYDSDAQTVVRTVGLDPDTGLPLLGLLPFGLAVEPIDPRRAITNVASSRYDPSPCVVGRDCQRIYVASFMQNWINILELDPDRPAGIALVKRIGRGP